MSLEVTQSASLAYSDGTTSDSLSLGPTTSTPGTKQVLHTLQLATTSAAVLNLGPIATPGQLLIVNRDPTNYVTIRASSGGANLIRLAPSGPPAMIQCDTGLATPYLLANTASCWVEYILVSA